MGEPRQRQWTVDLRARDPETGERYWDEEFAQQQTIEAYIECATIQHREGGGFVIGPIRQQLAAAPDSLSPDPVWANLGLVIQHTFMPPVKQRQPEPRPQLADDVAPGLDPDEDLEIEEPEMRDEDERTVAAELGNGTPVFPDPSNDVDAESSRLKPEDLLPKVG